jgi:hypothetical protein
VKIIEGLSLEYVHAIADQVCPREIIYKESEFPKSGLDGTNPLTILREKNYKN